MKPLASGIFSLALRWCAAAALLCAALALPQLAEAHSITPSASVALPGQPITFTAIATAPFNMSPTRVDFGDGSPIIFIPEPYPQFPVHTYALPGVYTVKLLEPAAPVTLAQTTVTIVSPATFSLTANPAGVIAGQVVMFTATTGAQKVPGAYVDFGDGSTAQLPSNFNAIQHRYASPAFYTARLLVVGGLNTLAQAQVTVTANSVQVPVGQVYSTFLVGSPVLAGADTAVALSYRIFTPFVIAPSGVSPLQAIVELSTAKGVVIQRSDPFALPFTQQNVNSAQTVMIPYTVPADAGGNYLITVYVRSANGGTVAIGRPQSIQIIGGPDPAPILSNAFHANGAILTGSGANRGSYGVNLGLTTAAQWASDELMLTGLFDPVSKKVDPLLTFVSATPAPITSPNATPAPNSTSTQVDSGQVPPPPTTGSPGPGSEPPGPKPEGSSSPAPTSAPAPSAIPSPQPTVAPSPPRSTTGTDRRSPAMSLAEANAPAATASATPQPQPPAVASPTSATPAPAPNAPPAPQPATPPSVPAAPSTPPNTSKNPSGVSSTRSSHW